MIVGPRQKTDEVTLLVERYRPAILAFFRRRLRDQCDAEDAAQEVFASLSRQHTLDEVQNIEGYIFQAAANHLRDRIRRASVRPSIELEGAADSHGRLIDDISPEREMLGREAYQVFVAALRELPERARVIFMLNRFEEMSGREIAQRLHISQRLVEKEISRVLMFLRGKLS
jgi:RNA polymerase sigma factor (sigma-70 family)